MFIDTHTHLSYSEGVNPDIFVKNALASDVKYLIVSCCSMDSIKEGLELIGKFDNIYLTIGIHPEYADSYTDDDLKYIYDVAKKNKRVVGIGEIGLDYHYSCENKDIQKSLFIKQLLIARKLNLPVVIHSRDAVSDTYDVLKTSDCNGVIHCYSGSLEMAKKYIDLGFYLGIGGVLTFTNSKLYSVIEKVGVDKLVLETDSPYLTPHPYRGGINESKYIPVIAKKIADVLNIDISDVAKVTSNNAKRIYGIDN